MNKTFFDILGQRWRDGGIGRHDRLNENLSAQARNPYVESPKFGGNPLEL